MQDNEFNDHYRDDEHEVKLKRTSHFKWHNVIIGGVIIGIFAFILFYQDSTPGDQHPAKLIANQQLPVTDATPAATGTAPAVNYVSIIASIPEDVARVSPTNDAPLINNTSELSAADTEKMQALAVGHTHKQPHKAIVKTAIASSSHKITPVKHHVTAAPASSSGYTIQLLAAQQKITLQHFIAANRLTGKVRPYTIERDGRVWYVLTYGHYSSYHAATMAINQLPANLKHTHPWPKLLTSYHKA